MVILSSCDVPASGGRPASVKKAANVWTIVSQHDGCVRRAYLIVSVGTQEASDDLGR